MRNFEQRQLARRWKKEGLSYNSIAQKLDISRNSAINLCYYQMKNKKMNRGPKHKMQKKHHLAIKRAISNLMSNAEKVNAPKIRDLCSLPVSVRTVRRYLNDTGHVYKNAVKQINLSKNDKQKRMEIIKKWISENHIWERTIFSDEKRFSLDGPDDWRSYVPKGFKINRNKRHSKGGSIMVWMMVMPNGLLSYRFVEGNLNSIGYIDILKKCTVPIIKLNYMNDFAFQEDNSSVHKSRIVQEFMTSSHINVLQWPSKSPDLNIVANCWKIICDRVYDGKQYQKKDDLKAKIIDVINDINVNDREKMKSLFTNYRSRLCTVLERHGNLCNK